MTADAFLEAEASDDDFLPPGMTREQFDVWIAEGDADIAAGRVLSGVELETWLDDFVAGRPLAFP